MAWDHSHVHGCVVMTGPDSRMDQRGNQMMPVNVLPVKCTYCTFPDPDFVPQPYFLAKGTAAPVDTASAETGNFFVRERARRILELAVPGACDFYPTHDAKTKKPTPWFLAVPKRVIRLFDVDKSVPRCPQCGEPRNAHPGTHFFPVDADYRGVDVFKTKEWSGRAWTLEELEKTNKHRARGGLGPYPWPREWGEPPTRPEHWRRVHGVDRSLYFSVRLEQLFKRAKVKGILRWDAFKDKPTPPDLEWVDAKLSMLAEQGLAEAPTAETPADVGKWFARYLKRNARKKAPSFDFDAVEKQHGVILPDDYKKLMSTVGPTSFDDVDGNEGFTARILPPAKLDFKGYRRGRVKDLDEESARVDGVKFADTDHGDCFVFDVSADRPPAAGDVPVYWYDHEQNVMESYAANFAACIKRFAQRG